MKRGDRGEEIHRGETRNVMRGWESNSLNNSQEPLPRSYPHSHAQSLSYTQTLSSVPSVPSHQHVREKGGGGGGGRGGEGEREREQTSVHTFYPLSVSVSEADHHSAGGSSSSTGGMTHPLDLTYPFLIELTRTYTLVIQHTHYSLFNPQPPTP